MKVPTSPASIVKRSVVLTYGLMAYTVFLATFLYAIGFVGNFAVPRTLDGAPTMPLWSAVAIDLALLGIFALQHSGMARPAFKRWWTRIVPPAAERSTYVLFSSIAMIAMFVLWQPLGGEVWTIDNPVGRAALWGAFAFGWLLVLVSTFLINHFDLFGLRQSWLCFRGREYTPLKFVMPWPYRVIRHPLYLGWLFVFWATPTMSAAHLLFALGTTGYILAAIRLEERDLMEAHADYAAYRRKVPMIVPGMRIVPTSECGEIAGHGRSGTAGPRGQHVDEAVRLTSPPHGGVK